MSIAVLSQVYTEARRLMIAGSVVARGDFRLKKLLPPLEQAGKQAPVFAKVAETAKAVIEGPEDSSAASLLELTSLVTAVLYTQGETGIEGKLQPVETTNLGGAIVQTNARILKPLLEALSSTGSGRLELVKDAHERGHFRDIRLIKPALAALDDPYPEIAELIATKVLPLYGKAILPELRAKYDPKGTKGHPRRLRLMHAIDPSGTRELVKDALENGSKEVKVAAISCLGSDASDLPFLVEQASAKAQDVRAAAYQALTAIDHPDATGVLQKALAGKDFAHAANAIESSKSSKLVDLLVEDIRSSIEGLAKLKDKKQIGQQISRLETLIASFPKGNFPHADKLLLDLFSRREEIVKIKGDTFSGLDIIESVIQQLANGSEASRKAIVAQHAEVPADQLEHVFDAARLVLTPAKLYETFSQYLTAKVDEKKKAKDPAWAKREAIFDAIESGSHFYFWLDDDDSRFDDEDRPKPPPYDPRWLDLAIKLQRLELVQALARPDHKEALAFVFSYFQKELKTSKSPDGLRNELYAMFRFHHPERANAFFSVLNMKGKKTPYFHYWFVRLVPRLPKDTLPKLEEVIATLPDSESRLWLDAVHELRSKE